MATSKYRNAGVDTDRASAVVAHLQQVHGSKQIGNFAAVSPLPGEFTNPVLVTTCDGVGSKLLLCAQTQQYQLAGHDLVAMCVNDLVCTGATPWLFLDYYACEKLTTAAATAVLQGITTACQTVGATLVGGETAQLPGMLTKDSFELAGVAIGIAEAATLIDTSKVADGDAIVGIRTPGIGCNGFTLVRAILAEHNLSLEVAVAGKQLAEHLLVPTPLYVDVVSEAQTQVALHAVAHITGGGLVGNLPRVLPSGLGGQLQLAKLPLPDLHAWLQHQGEISDAEMRRVFNHGIGLVLILAEPEVTKLCAVLQDLGHDAEKIGTVVATSGVEFA